MRSAWIWDGIWRDVRLAVRTLRATPVVTAIAILSLALGIGANTAIFSLVDSLVLRKLPVKEPDRLVLVTTTTPGVRAWSYPVWDHLRQASLFDHSAAWALRQFNLAARGETRFVDGLWASGSFFETLGVPALIGRTFSAPDDQPSGGSDGLVAVISHDFVALPLGVVGPIFLSGMERARDLVPRRAKLARKTAPSRGTCRRPRRFG